MTAFGHGSRTFGIQPPAFIALLCACNAIMDKSSFTVTKLYRDSLRLADYISTRSGINNHRAALWEQVRASFRKNAGETDPVKIEEQKDAAIRGLSNYMFHEAQRMAKEDIEQGKDTFDG